MSATETMELGGLFDQVDAAQADTRAEASALQRRQAVADHRRSLAACWEEWTAAIGGNCSVGQCCVHNLTLGRGGYYYCAPCRIVEISADQETYVVEIAYPAGTGDWLEGQNGQRLRLDILELWAPVTELAEARHAADLADQAAAKEVQ